MPNAMTGNQPQAAWLKAWKQRQADHNPNWDQSRMPKAGWRSRVHQGQYAQPAPWQQSPRPPVPGEYQHTGPRPGWDPNPRPDGTYGPPLPPPPPRPLGFRTLAPVGVPDGGWGGGAIEHETGTAGVSAPFDPFPASAAPPGMDAIGGSGYGYIYGPQRPPVTSKPGFSPGMPVPRTNAMREY